ncbi:MAG: Gfo/Idh/MocA family oxidoreductase [Sedimentisphaerales bacterium]|nr:Gfo/Idh/MocA family oxidoreductase [Sedimentisphaerales bacterium]
MNSQINRRSFLKHSAAMGSGITLLKSGILRAGNSPNEKLNIAVIGVGGRGQASIKGVKEENIVALCDVNEKHLAEAVKQFPEAETYFDWRKCLEQKNLDAVICATTDHTHAFVNVWAMNRGLHVYSEKPLANCVHEARVVRETYLKNKDKLATQMGTQIHASDNYRRMVELVRGGAIGVPKKAQIWCSRLPAGGEYLPDAGPAPDYMHWDLWIGPSPEHPFNPGYLENCLTWNLYWDFGSGQIGDMGSHMIDMAYWTLDLRFPTTCEAKGTPVSSDTCPQWLTAEWDHPANDWRPAVKVEWYDGGKKPGVPSKVFHRDEMFKGIIITGDQGWLVADYDYRILMLKGDMTHYHSPQPADLIPPSAGQHQEWINGCKNGTPTLCNFDYSGALIEHNLLALVAYRVGQPLEWEAENLKATNCPEADKYIYKTYREGWTLNG